jgi:hypothetical protein
MKRLEPTPICVFYSKTRHILKQPLVMMGSE